MAYLPQLTEGEQSRIMIEAFGGYNHNLRISEGEWYDEKNISSSHFPLFSQRSGRGIYKSGLTSPQGILAKDALAWVDGDKLYYNGYQVDGITLSTDPDDCPKQMVSMGAYLCIFPDGVYLNTADITDYGEMAATFTSIEDADIVYTPCRVDGTEYDMSNATMSTTEPEEPENGDYWLDTSSDTHVLKQYSASSGMWVQVPTVYTRIAVTGIGALFSQYDGVTVSGVKYTGDYAEMVSQLDALNAASIIQSVGEDYIVVIGLIDRVYTQQSGSITVERKVPRMDYVCESNNRLWGCFYGMADGEMLNEIYACKLGDFKNWNCFMGLSTDSYTASVGTDGEFTGAITYLGYPTFFKENFIHKMYGTMPSTFQIQTTACRGVQKGSSGSLAIVNEMLFYKSRSDVCAYDGSLPGGVSTALGTEFYSSAAGGSFGGKYHVSMRDSSGAWHYFVYDTVRGVWHREDDTHATSFTAWGDELFYLDEDRKMIIAENGTVGAPEGRVEWMAETGLLGYDMIDSKYISRYNLRMRLGADAYVKLQIEYDSDGVWHDEGTVRGAGIGAFVLPVIPRRCDHFRYRLTGAGDIKIYSIAKIIEQGSDAG